MAKLLICHYGNELKIYSILLYINCYWHKYNSTQSIAEILC